MKTNLVRSSVQLLAFAGLAFQIGCAAESPRAMAPPVTYGAAATEAKPQILNITPQVDILMVIDNSSSMKDEQETLSANIDKFAKGLAASGGIDFHVGVVSVWDTMMFKEMKKDYGLGELRRLKTPDGKEVLPDTFGRYVDSSANYDEYLASKGFSLKKEAGWVQVLRSSMNIGVESYNPKYAEEKTGGPEVEELFSPVKAALSEPNLSGANKGFRRSGAHLVTVFITDADAFIRHSDGNYYDISSGDLQEFLRGQLGENFRDEVTAIGILTQRNDPDSQRDPAINSKNRGANAEPTNLLGYIRDLGGKQMGLRGKDYGTKMAEIGSYVRSRTLSRPRVDLNSIPEWGTVKVTLNGEDLVLGDSWQYDDVRNSVLITRDLTGVKGALDIKVGFTPVTAGSVKTGRVLKAAGK